MDRARHVRLALRGLAAIALAFGGLLAVCAYVAGVRDLAVVLALFVAPALLVWFRPQPRSVATWAGFEYLIAMPIALTVGRGEIWNKFDVLVAAVLGGLPFVSHAAAAALAARPPQPLSPLARKLRTIAIVAFAIAAVMGVFAFFPGLAVDHDGTLRAGGLAVLVLIGVLVGPGLVVFANPTRANGWKWASYGLCLGPPALAILVFLRFAYGYDATMVELWPLRVVKLALGTLVVLIVAVQGLVLLTTRGDDDPGSPPLPPARAIK